MIFKNVAITTMSLVSATMLAAAGAIAQVTPAPTLSEQTLREAQQQEKSPLSVGGSNLNLLQLINNINLAGGKSPEQFRASQDESFDEAVSNFRNQQRREVKISIPAANTQTN
jgi:tRNA A37 N6-isopentenylltransferase MiaA